MNRQVELVVPARPFCHFMRAAVEISRPAASLEWQYPVGLLHVQIIRMEQLMKYLLMIYGDEGAEASAPEAATTQVMSAYMAYSQALIRAGDPGAHRGWQDRGAERSLG